MSNYTKLKTNLKLAIQRLKLLEKKKSKYIFFLKLLLFEMNFNQIKIIKLNCL